MRHTTFYCLLLSHFVLSLSISFVVIGAVQVYAFSQGLPRADSLETVLTEANISDTLKVQILCDLSKEYEARNAVRALVFARQALWVADSLGYQHGIAKSQLRMGIVLWLQGFYEESVEYNFRALRICQQLKDTSNLARALGGIGANYRKLNNYAKAKEYYTEALSLSTRVGDKQGMESMMNNLGVLYFGEGMYDSALVYWQRALEIDVELGDSASIALVSANVAWALTHIGNEPVATRFATQALQTAESIGDKRVAALACHVLAQISSSQFRYADAEQYEKKALSLAEQYGGQEIMRWAYQMLSLIAESTGRHAEALWYFKEFKAFSDSMHISETAERTAVLTAQFRDEERQQEIARLRKDAEHQAVLRSSLLVGLALAIAILVLIIRRYQDKRRNEQELLARQAALDEQSRAIERANAQLAEQNQQLQFLNEEKNEILGIVAHDLKNPIGAVLTFAEIISGNDTPPSEFPRIGESIAQTSRRMLDLVNHLLDANAIESGKIQLVPAYFDAAVIVEMICGEYAEQAAEKGITIHYTYHNSAYNNTTSSARVYLDESSFMQIIENLLSNAIKYSPLNTNVWVRVQTLAREKVRIEIQDEGFGFSPEDKEKLFTKFARLSAKPTGGEHSTGLGLAIVKKLVDLLQGTIRCESQAGAGATFILEFPLNAAPIQASHQETTHTIL